MKSLSELRVKIYADGADIESMVRLASLPHIQGLTTNPTLMKLAGIADYAAFASAVLSQIADKPISFEVFADDFDNMLRQARLIAQWGDNVYVKIPVTTTAGVSCAPVVNVLSHEGVKLNVTALMTPKQVETVIENLSPDTPSVISVFAGRVADTGRDPIPLMAECLRSVRTSPNAELLWASPRELLNIFHADEVGCDIITVTPDVLKKLELLGKDLDQYSVETVQMFHRDATAAGYTL